MFASIRDTLAKLEARRTTSEELSQAVLDRVSQLDPLYNSYADIIADRALIDAISSDTRRRKSQLLSPLDGIPVAVKNNIDTTPAACSAGLGHLVDYRPATDAKIVRQLRRAGAVIVGVTQTDSGAFGTSTPQVINPVSSGRSVGGSSGGSAAAVAAGLAFGALGTDTGGSIRIPAACCCVCGFKPSYGTVSTEGVRPLSFSLDHVGPIARSISDLAIMFGTMSPNPRPNSERPLRSIGIATEYFRDAQTEVQHALERTVGKITKAGVEIREVTLPSPESTLEFHLKSSLKEASDYHISHFPEEWANYPDVARTSIEIGLGVKHDAYQQALSESRKAAVQVDDALGCVDVLVVPTLPVNSMERWTEKYVLGEGTFGALETSIRYTALFDQTKHPVVSLPALLGDAGDIFSIQVVGKRGADHQLLHHALHLEQVFNLNLDYESITCRELEACRRLRASIGPV